MTIRKRRAVSGLLLLAVCSGAFCQQAGFEIPVGITDEPCPPPVMMPAGVRDMLARLFMEPRQGQSDDSARLAADPGFSAYLASLRTMGDRDWPGLCRFRAANASVIASGHKPRVVFMGDSITENWLLGDPALFDEDFVNRGIGAQTTPQMLLRFQADVVALEPAAVHILAGTNDIAGNTGPSTPQDLRNNFMAMATLARARGISVLLGSVPPAARFDWQPDVDPVETIREVNAWLRRYAEENDMVYIDYYAALAGEHGELRAELGNDGVHPNRAGYALMRELLETALREMEGE